MSALKLAERERIYGRIARLVFAEHGLPESWAMALVRQESQFNPYAINQTGGDKLRGGSFGLCQVSLQTARALGFTETATGPLLDPATNAKFAALVFIDNQTALKRLKIPADLANLASMYNSGKPLKTAPFSTREVYVPNVLKYAKEYEVVYGSRQRSV